MDGFKYIVQEEVDSIPKTIILNRSISSIGKVAAQLYSFPISYLLYQAIYALGLDANPEHELLNFFQRIEQNHPQSMEGRKVVIIEARNDRYFSGNGALDPSLCDNLVNTGAEVYQGSFFIPLVAEAAHHALRLDWLLNNEDSGTVSTQFLHTEKNESVSSSLVRNLMSEVSEDGYHTCFIVGGNRDSLDSITFLQAAPLLSAFVN